MVLVLSASCDRVSFEALMGVSICQLWSLNCLEQARKYTGIYCFKSCMYNTCVIDYDLLHLVLTEICKFFADFMSSFCATTNGNCHEIACVCMHQS